MFTMSASVSKPEQYCLTMLCNSVCNDSLVRDISPLHGVPNNVRLVGKKLYSSGYVYSIPQSDVNVKTFGRRSRAEQTLTMLCNNVIKRV